MIRHLFEKHRKTSTIRSAERFTRDTTEKPKILCVYVAFNIDEYDLNFITKNQNDCTIVVIESVNAPSLFNHKLKNNQKIEYRTRPNVGYDVTAWKEYILENYGKIKTFDYLVLVNNSCRYDFLIKDAIADMKRKNATFYGLNRSPVRNEHIQSYFTVTSKRLTESRAFYEHWSNIPEISDREDAIDYHELTYMNDMVKGGADIGTLTDYNFIGSTYEPERYNGNMGVIPPFMKKRLIYSGTNLSNYERLLKKLPHMI